MRLDRFKWTFFFLFFFNADTLADFFPVPMGAVYVITGF
jgi:hypothetical protein